MSTETKQPDITDEEMEALIPRRIMDDWSNASYLAVANGVQKQRDVILELQARLIRRTEESTANAYRDAETIRMLRKSAAPCARGWHPMESAPRNWKVIFWIVPKPPEECYTNSDRTPIISWNTPRFLFCEYGCWPSVDKAIAWMEPPCPPAPAALT